MPQAVQEGQRAPLEVSGLAYLHLLFVGTGNVNRVRGYCRSDVSPKLMFRFALEYPHGKNAAVIPKYFQRPR